MERFISRLKWWFAWDSEKLEDWLEDMAMQGWHLAQVDGLLINFLFERGEPRRVRYCMDYQREDKFEYRQIFRDAGWSLLRNSMGWYVWSLEYEGARPHIYTDANSLIRRNRGLMATMAIILATQAPLMWLNYMNLSHLVKSNPEVFVVLAVFVVSVYALLGYCIVRLALSIRRLKRRKAQ